MVSLENHMPPHLDDSQSQKEQDRMSCFTKQYLATPSDSLSSHCSITLVESLAISTDAIPDSYVTEDQHGLPVIPSLSHLDLKEKQRADPSTREVITQMEFGEKIPPTVRKELPELPLLLRQWNRLELQNDILYRRRQDGEQMSYRGIKLN